MKIVISTQTYEWYGSTAPTEGKGRWKAKGGNDYIIANVPLNLLMEGNKALDAHVTLAFNTSNKTFPATPNCEYYEYILDWSIEEDDFLTYDEKLQMEFDGSITYPAKVILDHRAPEEVF